MLQSKPIIIFVRPRARGNVGALARVMSNFGVEDLRFVNEPIGADAFSLDSATADWAMACRGASVLKQATTFASLSDALHDVHWALGTSARERGSDPRYARPLVDFAQYVRERDLPAQKWAIVLGTEDDGLSDEELSLCQTLTTIPTHSASPSMNVAMAAGCLLYHWKVITSGAGELGGSVAASPDANEDFASLGEVDKLAEFILGTLKLTDFFKYPDESAVLARLRRLFQKEAPLTRGDILFAFEIFYQLKSKITGHHGNRNFLG